MKPEPESWFGTKTPSPIPAKYAPHRCNLTLDLGQKRLRDQPIPATVVLPVNLPRIQEESLAYCRIAIKKFRSIMVCVENWKDLVHCFVLFSSISTSHIQVFEMRIFFFSTACEAHSIFFLDSFLRATFNAQGKLQSGWYQDEVTLHQQTDTWSTNVVEILSATKCFHIIVDARRSEDRTEQNFQQMQQQRTKQGHLSASRSLRF